MEAFEKIAPIGEGTYGVVMKCRHKDSGLLVAIKKFKESEEDAQIRKTAMREVRMLKQLRHDNIVNLLDVFRRKGKLYLVFEYVDRTILEDLERNPHGLSDDRSTGVVRKCMYQLLRALEFLHSHNVIHRDIKPENILLSSNGVIKLCDFGFARTLAGPGARYTDYVATRWYRSPELLVGDTEYGKPVDIWAVGCIFAELVSGQPLFPGDSDIDQLYRIMKCLGQLNRRHMEVFLKNPLFVGLRIPDIGKVTPLEARLPMAHKPAIRMMEQCLLYDPEKRPSAKDLLSNPYFTEDGWSEKFEQEIRHVIEMENQGSVGDKLKPRRTRSNGSDAVSDDGGARDRDRDQRELKEIKEKRKEKREKEELDAMQLDKTIPGKLVQINAKALGQPNHIQQQPNGQQQYYQTQFQPPVSPPTMNSPLQQQPNNFKQATANPFANINTNGQKPQQTQQKQFGQTTLVFETSKKQVNSSFSTYAAAAASNSPNITFDGISMHTTPNNMPPFFQAQQQKFQQPKKKPHQFNNQPQPQPQPQQPVSNGQQFPKILNMNSLIPGIQQSRKTPPSQSGKPMPLNFGADWSRQSSTDTINIGQQAFNTPTQNHGGNNHVVLGVTGKQKPYGSKPNLYQPGSS